MLKSVPDRLISKFVRNSAMVINHFRGNDKLLRLVFRRRGKGRGRHGLCALLSHERAWATWQI